MLKWVRFWVCAVALVVGFATVLHAQLWVSSSTSLTTDGKVSITNSAEDALTVTGGIKSAGGDVAVLNQNETITGLWTFNNAGIRTSTSGTTISPPTSDGSDTSGVILAGGGQGANGRGAFVGVFGNEHATFPGRLLLYAGTTGYVDILGRINSSSVQPGFLAYNSVTDTGLAGSATVDFDTEVYDTTNSFANDVFTAPVIGTYLLCATVTAFDITLGGGAYVWIATTSHNYAIGEVTNDSADREMTASGCVLAPLSAGGTARVLLALGAGGSVRGDSGGHWTFFSGRLVP